ncbi:MAG: MEDS domain-containing protein [Acidimicrobiales bacterium]
MSARTLDRPATSPDSFRHDALVYRGEEEFVDAISSFVLDGLEADEPVLVVVSARKIALLEARLGAATAAVCFIEMAELGRNPARIIPAWRKFVDKHADRGNPPRGVGERCSRREPRPRRASKWSAPTT